MAYKLEKSHEDLIIEMHWWVWKSRGDHSYMLQNQQLTGNTNLMLRVLSIV